LNQGGYYDTLLAFTKEAIAHGFMSDWQMGLVTEGSEPEPLLKTLVESAGFSVVTERLQAL
jgi:predicted Rossmann-fold nucleotide-binding protein